MSKKLSYDVIESGQRVDKAIHIAFPEYTRSKIQNWLKNQRVLLNGQPVKANYKVKKNDHIEIEVPAPKLIKAIPENIPLDIVYEDDDVLVVNKPQGMVVHPSAGHEDHTLVNALLYHTTFSDINDEIRPGIVHRIDKDTSGLLMVAKNEAAMQSLSRQLKAKSNERVYLAIVHGIIKENKGTINAPLGRDPKDRKKQSVIPDGRLAVTHFEVIERFLNSNYTLIKCILETGRTHQIRVHLRYIGHPIAGDPTYGPKKTLKGHGQFLHAAVLGFKHPKTGQQLHFEAPLPKIFADTLTDLRKKN